MNKINKNTNSLIKKRNRTRKEILRNPYVDNQQMDTSSSRTECCCEPVIYGCPDIGFCGGDENSTMDPYNGSYYNVEDCTSADGIEYFEDC